MILVDTSVWIDFFRKGSPSLMRQLNELLDDDRVVLAAPVRLEILSGAPKHQKPMLRRLLSALPFFFPSEETWLRIETRIEHGHAKGQCFGAMDLLIAAIAQDHSFALWSLDSDFQRMASLGWVELYRMSDSRSSR